MKLEPIENPIVIHPHLLQKFLKHGKDYANLLALYSFYLYHAQRQKTNQPLAPDEFTRKGMNWAMERVKKTKKILKGKIWGQYWHIEKWGFHTTVR
jgi:hypothetical protein